MQTGKIVVILWPLRAESNMSLTMVDAIRAPRVASGVSGSAIACRASPMYASSATASQASGLSTTVGRWATRALMFFSIEATSV